MKDSKIEINKNLEIRMSCFLADGEYLWFVPEEAGILCRYHLKREMIDYMRIVPGEAAHGRAYASIAKYKDKIVLVPYFSREVAVFDVTSEDFIKIRLSQAEKEFTNREKFDYSVMKGKYLYMFPGKQPYVVKMDLDSLEIFQSENIYALCNRFFETTMTSGGVSTLVWDGDNSVFVGIGILCGKEEHIGLAKINLETLQIDIRKVSCIKSWIKGLVWNEDRLYVYSAEGRITILDDELNSVQSILDSELCDYDLPYQLNIRFCCMSKGSLYFIRGDSLKMVIVDIVNHNKVYKKRIIDDEIILAGQSQRGIILQTHQAGYFYIEENELLTKRLFSVSRTIIEKSFHELTEITTDTIYENLIFPLQDWLEFMGDKGETSYSGKKPCIGDMIYKSIN